MIKIVMFRAGYGDTILVQIENKTNEYNLLIDCGFGYKDGLLNFVNTKFKDKKINKFIITHYDSDHITSASKFLEDNGDYNNPQMVKIEQIWLNTFKHLQFSKRANQVLNQDTKEQIQELITKKLSELPIEDNEGDIGAKQATLLGKTILKYDYPWNFDSKGEAICIENMPENIKDDSVKFTLLTPSKERLENLEKEFIKDLKKLGFETNADEIFDDAFELLTRENNVQNSNEGNISSSSYVINSNNINTFSKGGNYLKDDSVGNGSSISFVIEAEGKKMLFLADAFAEDVISRLEMIYPNKDEYPIFFDLIKVSHHGSFRNNKPELFEIIDSDKFLFSTNGKHPKHVHPDIDTISCIINRNLPKDVEFRELIFNYDLEHLNDFKTKELEEEFSYKIKNQLVTEL
ncbi:MBL fold metallo-hydrolase [Epilithonimonas lactis]|uniref:Metallo-beta-lactamase domain-containing protein n=1 Tax=Epilithonimonas lactis TaxID=421072 RepID=A0A085B772_9FLAO|nr:MBL fold metallo-hydrolase [Epilithonimonas lactis]KFC18317.1 hypothetical protein IO89_17605 [Epilithonimonas lactis]